MKIDSILEGCFCGGCGNPIHDHCAPSQPSGSVWGICDKCGCELLKAPACDSNVEQFIPNPFLGCGLRILGIMLNCVSLYWVVIISRGHPGALDGGLAILLLSAGAWLVTRGRKATALRVDEVLQRDIRAPILLLRSFADDEFLLDNPGRGVFSAGQTISFEEVLAKSFSPFGPVIAIGHPGEMLPPLGFARFWVQDGSWKGRVAKLLEECQKVVVILGATPGLAWEVDQLFQRDVPRKVVLLLPPMDEQEAQQRWQAARLLFREHLPPYQGGEVAATFDAQWKCRVERTGSLTLGHRVRFAEAYRGVVDLIMGQPRASARNGRNSLASSLIHRLIQDLEDQREHVRWDAARQLGRMGQQAKDAVPVLIRLLSDRDGGVRRAAHEAIEAIDPDGRSNRI